MKPYPFKYKTDLRFFLQKRNRDLSVLTLFVVTTLPDL